MIELLKLGVPYKNIKIGPSKWERERERGFGFAIKRQNEILWLVAKFNGISPSWYMQNGNFTLPRILCNEMWYQISNKIATNVVFAHSNSQMEKSADERANDDAKNLILSLSKEISRLRVKMENRTIKTGVIFHAENVRKMCWQTLISCSRFRSV